MSGKGEHKETMMISDLQSVKHRIKKELEIAESKLYVYERVTSVCEEFDGKRIDKKMKDAIEQALGNQYRTHYYRDGHYTRVVVQHIGMIHQAKQFQLVLHYAKNGDKFQFDKFP